MRPLFSLCQIALALLLIHLSTPASCFADNFITFGSDSNTAGKGKIGGPNSGSSTLKENKDSLNLATPNFWSGFAQYDLLNLVLPEKANPKDFLILEIKGSASGREPKLKVLFFSPEWKHRTTWIFDLRDLKADQYTAISAATTYDSPFEAPADGPLDAIGVIQIVPQGKDDQAWNLDIKGLGMASRSAP